MGEKGLEPVYEPPRPGDVRHSQADISRAREFGYRPSYDLEKGLKETIGLWHES
jgi:nucleoside-diphosphate-sugar epimerase